MSKQVKIGIVGTSWWTDAMYLPALTRHPAADVCAVVGRNLDHTHEFAKQWVKPSFRDGARIQRSRQAAGGNG
jgi:predicted dehydrogenase